MAQREDKPGLQNASSELTQETLRDYQRARPLGPQPKICYAPFKNMYFGHKGRVTVCCHNTTYEIGRYPEQSIHDIWFGEKARQLRQYIDDYNLNHGCQGCKASILAHNFDAAKSKQYDEQKWNENGYPSVLEFELSNTCNLECVMCNGVNSSSIRKNRDGLPPLYEPYDEKFAVQLRDFLPHLEETKFYGGEPFLVDTYYRIWDELAAINPQARISVQTNATILNNRVKRLLDKLNFHINISIDSLEKNNYERIRKNGQFDKVKENMLYFHNYCRERNTFFGLSACAMRQNWHEIPEFIRFCNELEAPVYFHTVYYPPHCALHNLPSQKLEEIHSYLASFTFPEETTVQRKNKVHFEGIKNQIRGWMTMNAQKQDVQIDSYEELRSYLTSIIREWDDTGTAKDETIRTIEKKIEQLQEALNDDKAIIHKLNDANLKNEVIIENLIHQLTNSTISELTHVFKNEIYEQGLKHEQETF